MPDNDETKTTTEQNGGGTTTHPTLPKPVQPTEPYQGYSVELERLQKAYSGQFKALSSAEKRLEELRAGGVESLPAKFIRGLTSFANPFSRHGYSPELLDSETVFSSEEEFNQAVADAQAESTLHQRLANSMEWRIVVLNNLPFYMSHAQYTTNTIDDIRKIIDDPATGLTESDTAWLKSTFDKLSYLNNILPEEFSGSVTDAQNKIVDTLLTEPKQELQNVLDLTLEELAQAFQPYAGAELPENLTVEDVRSILEQGQYEITSEADQEWAAQVGELSRIWREDTQRQNLILAGTLSPVSPSLTPGEFFKLAITQPMMAPLQMLNKYFDIVARPMFGATLLAAQSWWGTEGTASAGGRMQQDYNRLRAEGHSAWSAYAQALNEADLPWWFRLEGEMLFDPSSYVGLGIVTHLATKAGSGLTRIGLRGVGSRIGPLVGSIENGWLRGADAIFVAGKEAILSPVKGSFWLAGAGYKIPQTLTTMSRAFAGRSYKDFEAVVSRIYGGMRGRTAKELRDTARLCVDMSLGNPLEGFDLEVKMGSRLLEYSYLDAEYLSSKLLKGILPEGFELDTMRLARVNDDVLNMFSGQPAKETAGKLLQNLEPSLYTFDNVKAVTTRLIGLREATADKAMKVFEATSPREQIKGMMSRLEDVRYQNLRNPISSHMNDVGRYISWVSRVADRLLYSSGMVALERKLVVPMARWNLLFSSLGPNNYLENAYRSGLGGAEVMYPTRYGGADETARLLEGLTNVPHSIGRGGSESSRLDLATLIDPKTGKSILFREGKIPFVSKTVRIGGKEIGTPSFTIRGKKYKITNLQDHHSMWGDLTDLQRNYDFQTLYLKALADKNPGAMRTIVEIESKHHSELGYISRYSKKDARDIRQQIIQESTRNPDAVRELAGITLREMERRNLNKELQKTMERASEVPVLAKKEITGGVLNGSMLADVDSGMAAVADMVRELSLADLTPQIDALQKEADRIAEVFASSPPKNIDELLREMDGISAIQGAVQDRISNYKRLEALRVKNLEPGKEADNFRIGSNKLMEKFLGEAEDDIGRVSKVLQDFINSTDIPLTDFQRNAAELLNNVRVLEVSNVAKVRRDLAEVSKRIAAVPKGKRSKMWPAWESERSGIWDEFFKEADKLYDLKLDASRQFLGSLGKAPYVPNSIPPVVKELTPNHIAYLYGVTGDDVYRGLTTVENHIVIQPRERFVANIRSQANAYASQFEKSAADIGFTDEAIGDVYDQLWRNLGLEPNSLAPDSPTMLQLDDIRQELNRLNATKAMSDTDLEHWQNYTNGIADDLEQTSMYQKAAVEADSPQVVAHKLGVKFDGMQEIPIEPVGEGIAGLENIEYRKVMQFSDEVTGDTFHASSYDEALTRLTAIRERFNAPAPRIRTIPEHMGSADWWATKESAASTATTNHHLSYPNYEVADTHVIDETMRSIFPFWTYESFRWQWLPRTFMRTPGTMTGLARYMDYTDGGYIQLPFTDLQINPLRGSIWMGGFRRFFLKDFPEYYDAFPGMEFIDYVGRAGWYPGIHVMGPIVLFGALQGGKPEFSEITPVWLQSTFSALRALSPEHIGKVLDVIYPDRFRDFNTMLVLGEWGYDADTIWKKKRQGIKLTEEEEKLWLRAEANADGLKGILRQQSGVMRLRPEEYSKVKQEMRLAIEEATGVSVRIQEQIDRLYPVTGKRFSDYYSLDILQQKLLYSWDSYRRWQGITTPLYPSGWQMMEVKISDYYEALEENSHDARYNGVYDEDGELVRPSMVDINSQRISGEIGPDQWKSMRSIIMTGTTEAARGISNSPAYVDVPKTLEERNAWLTEKGVLTPTFGPDQELLYAYYEIQPEYKYNWDSGRDELDFDAYYAKIDYLLESLDDAHRQRFLERVQLEWTGLEKLYWSSSREYLRPYRNIRDIILNQYTDEQRQQIRRYEVARGAEREELKALPGPEGHKLIAGFESKVREARQRLRYIDPTLDAWSYFWGNTDSFLTAEAEEIYNGLTKQYLIPSMAE